MKKSTPQIPSKNGLMKFDIVEHISKKDFLDMIDQETGQYIVDKGNNAGPTISDTSSTVEPQGTQERGSTNSLSFVENPEEPQGTTGISDSPQNSVPVIPVPAAKKKRGGYGEFQRNWMLTWNNPRHKMETLFETLKDAVPTSTGYVGQAERGSKNGTLHYHLLIRFVDMVRFSALKSHTFGLGNPRLDAIKDRDAAMKYVTKLKTRVQPPIGTGCYVNLPKPDRYAERILKRECFMTWQSALYEDLLDTEPNDRTVWWAWSNKGKIGKSNFVNYMAFHHEAETMCIDGCKKSDIAFALSKRIDNGDDIKYVFLDISRASSKSLEGMYDTIEKLKNGKLFSGKYESKELRFGRLHVICFANFFPKYANTQLSKDRWRMVYLDRLHIVTEHDKKVMSTIQKAHIPEMKKSTRHLILPPHSGT